MASLVCYFCNNAPGTVDISKDVGKPMAFCEPCADAVWSALDDIADACCICGEASAAFTEIGPDENGEKGRVCESCLKRIFEETIAEHTRRPN